MPQQPKRPCSRAGCRRLVGRKGCDCGKAQTQDYDRKRENSTKRGYGYRWRKVRLVHLRMEPLCRFCDAEGMTVGATEVDHIVPIREGGAHFDHDNLRSLCKSCHSKRTARDNGSFGRRRRKGEGEENSGPPTV